MENSLREMVYRDSLTGLHNRRYLESQTPELESDEYLPLSVIIGDVNGLKIINDSMGHEKGDEYLKRAAQAFREVARPKDLVIRWGGDEFVLVLPRTDSQEAQGICARISSVSSDAKNGVITPSIALGCATRTSLEESISHVLREAETRMYQQKISSAQSRRSALVLSLQQALAEKSHETEEHARNLQKLAVNLAERLGLSDSDVVTSSLVSLLHDIGKLHIRKHPGQAWTING
ncbi:MAG: diguanylate cyclase [Firmicutes bacterium]|nr:diguanylate cyclase [Bacillota bacterium]